ncbi:hypothetical protein BGZ73_004951 [Actinomortierella ambigua]|nr:hypothetical protein BGZ73_004951 [Actinomortierella ambigua]
MGELQSMPSAGPEDRKKMMRILHRFENEDMPTVRSPEQQDSTTEVRKKALTPRERQEILSKTHKELSGETVSQKQHLSESSSKANAEGRTSVGSRGSRVEDLKESAEGDLDEDDEDDDDEEDEDEDEDEKAYLDFVSRLANVDLEKESFESLWARLSPAEQKGFRDMIGTRNLSAQPRYPEGTTPEDEEDEEEAVLKLMQATGRELQEALQVDDPLMADLDDDDLRAIRETEIAALVPVWRPWWEVQAEEQGQLRRVDLVETTEDVDAATKVALEGQEKASKGAAEDKGLGGAEKLILDEEALLRPYSRPLVQDVTKTTEGTPSTQSSTSLPAMTKPPHPSLVYHLAALVFAYAATSRALNGDLNEFPEETLAHLLDLCPFLAPPAAAASQAKNQQAQQTALKEMGGTSPVEIRDFSTLLVAIQEASLASKDRWKGDTLRLELLVLLVQDLALLFALPQRCATVLQEIRQVVDRISTTMSMATTATNPPTSKGKKGPFSKTFVFRVAKKLEFYESFVQSPWFLGTTPDQQPALIDVVRMEVLMEGARVRQELQGWERDLETSEKLRRELKEKEQSEASSPAASTNKPLIEEL